MYKTQIQTVTSNKLRSKVILSQSMNLFKTITSTGGEPSVYLFIFQTSVSGAFQNFPVFCCCSHFPTALIKSYSKYVVLVLFANLVTATQLIQNQVCTLINGCHTVSKNHCWVENTKRHPPAVQQNRTLPVSLNTPM